MNAMDETPTPQAIACEICPGAEATADNTVRHPPFLRPHPRCFEVNSGCVTSLRKSIIACNALWRVSLALLGHRGASVSRKRTCNWHGHRHMAMKHRCCGSTTASAGPMVVPAAWVRCGYPGRIKHTQHPLCIASFACHRFIASHWTCEFVLSSHSGILRSQLDSYHVFSCGNGIVLTVLHPQTRTHGKQHMHKPWQCVGDCMQWKA